MAGVATVLSHAAGLDEYRDQPIISLRLRLDKLSSARLVPLSYTKYSLITCQYDDNHIQKLNEI